MRGYSGEEGFLQALIDGQVAAIQAISGAGLAKGWDALAKSAKLAKLAKLAKVDVPDLPTGKLPNLPDGDLPEGFPGSCFVAGTPIQTEEGGKPIESLRVGDRVLTTDGSSSTSIEPANWRKIRLRMPNPEAPADILEIELLRSIQWIAATGCEPGTLLWFVLEEMGLRGWAEVVGIDACPVIESGRGRVVLATVNHENTFVMELRLRGQEQPLLPTDRHCLFSVTRNDWIPAAHLQPGEELQTMEGTVLVEKVKSWPGVHRVFNLEVETEHSYFAGEAKVLSHNNNPCAANTAGRTNAQLVQEVATRADAWGTRQGLGLGPRAGTLKHSHADDLLSRYQRRFGDRGLSTEVPYLDGTAGQTGRGSIRLDVVEGPLDNPTAIFDYKFGGATLTPQRIQQIRQVGQFGPNVPITGVHP